MIYTSKKSYNFVDDGQHVEVVSLPPRLIQIQCYQRAKQGTNKVNKPKTTTKTYARKPVSSSSKTMIVERYKWMNGQH